MHLPNTLPENILFRQGICKKVERMVKLLEKDFTIRLFRYIAYILGVSYSLSNTKHLGFFHPV